MSSDVERAFWRRQGGWRLGVALCATLLAGGRRSEAARLQDACCTNVGATTRAAGSQAGALEGVPGFAKVTPSLYRGGQPTRAGFRQLERMGVRTIVSLRAVRSERSLIEGLGFGYMRLSFKHIHPEQEDVLAFLKVATAPECQPVFVHCQEGVDRTGMMVAVHRVVIQGWSKDAAMAEMRRMGFHVVWDPIEDYVERLDAPSLLEKLRATPMPKVAVVP